MKPSVLGEHEGSKLQRYATPLEQGLENTPLVIGHRVLLCALRQMTCPTPSAGLAMSHALPPSPVRKYTEKMISDARTGVPGTRGLLEEVNKKWMRSQKVIFCLRGYWLTL